jgi:hypothetical protein
MVNVWLEVSTATLVQRFRRRQRESESQLDTEIFDQLKHAYGRQHQEVVRQGCTVFSLDGEQSAERVAAQLKMLVSWIKSDNFCMIPLSVGRDPYGRTIVVGFAPPSGLVSVRPQVDEAVDREAGRERLASAVRSTNLPAASSLGPAMGVPYHLHALAGVNSNHRFLPRLPPPEAPDAPPSPPGSEGVPVDEDTENDSMPIDVLPVPPELNLPPSVRSLEMALRLSESVPAGTLDALLSASSEASLVRVTASQEEVDAFHQWLNPRFAQGSFCVDDGEGESGDESPSKRQRVTSPPDAPHGPPAALPASALPIFASASAITSEHTVKPVPITTHDTCEHATNQSSPSSLARQEGEHEEGVSKI